MQNISQTTAALKSFVFLITPFNNAINADSYYRKET